MFMNPIRSASSCRFVLSTQHVSSPNCACDGWNNVPDHPSVTEDSKAGLQDLLSQAVINSGRWRPSGEETGLVDCCCSQPFQSLKWKMMMGHSLNEVTGMTPLSMRHSFSQSIQLQHSDIQCLLIKMETPST